MKHQGLAALAALCLVLCAGSRTAQAAAAPTLHTLKNGIRVVLESDSLAMGVDVALWYPAGTAAERPGLAGASHLAERLMYRGSAAVADGDHLRRLLAAGAQVNTQMSPDYASFWQTVPSEALALALRLEAARMAGLTYGPEAFEAERRGARNDLRALRDRPVVARAVARLRASLFAGTAYARALQGSDADLARMTARELETWRKGAYAPGGAILTIVGRFEPDATLAAVRKLFEPLPRGAVVARPAPRAPAAGERREWSREDTPARLLLAGWQAPPASDPDAPALELLALVLGSGEGSRLHRSLVTEWRAALLTQAGFLPNREASMFWAMAALDAAADSSMAENALLDQVSRLAREPISAEELERVRTPLVTSELFRMQTVRARAQALGEAVCFTGNVAGATQRLETLGRVTPADLQRAAQRLVTDGARALVWLAPQQEGVR